MPYADIEAHRAAQREGARRRRAAKREAMQATAAAAMAPAVAPSVAPAEPATASPFPTGTELAHVAQMLRLDWQVGESPAAFHTRLKEAYALLVRVCA